MTSKILDSGDGDFLYEVSSLEHIAMRKKEICMSFVFVTTDIVGYIGNNLFLKLLGFVSEVFLEN